MNYIYDIVLNFQKNYCNFYEWKINDKVDSVRKIPLYRVSREDFEILKYSDVVVDNEFIEKIKSDIGNCKKIMCLVSDGNMGIGILFNNSGKLIKRSSMIYEEEDEVCDYVLNFDCIEIKYSYNKKSSNNLELRFCRERRKFLLKFLNNITNDMVWQYLYYDCFFEDLDDVLKIKKILYGVANSSYSEVNNRLYDSVCKFFKILN